MVVVKTMAAVIMITKFNDDDDDDDDDGVDDCGGGGGDDDVDEYFKITNAIVIRGPCASPVNSCRAWRRRSSMIMWPCKPDER